MRKLASIQRILAVKPIEGADLIEAVEVLGWTVVVKKGEFKVGDLCVYFEIDSFLNAEDPRYASFEERFINWNGKRGMRLKTIRLRKQVSQGLVLSVDQFDELHELTRSGEPAFLKYGEGDNVTDVLKIEKWEPAEETSSNNGGNGPQKNKSKPFPSFLRKSDQERIQNYVGELKRHKDELFEVTIKLDGSSMTVYYIDCESRVFDEVAEEVEARLLRKMGKFQRIMYKVKKFCGLIKKPNFYQGVCSRNIELDIDDDSHFSTYVRENGIFDKMPSAGNAYALQGELIAPTIQGNYEQVEDFQFHVYAVYDIAKQEYVDPYVAQLTVEGLGLSYVPVLKTEAKLSDFGDVENDPRAVVDAILAYAEGPGLSKGVKREGVVFKSLNSNFSFKAISNSYLLKKG